MSGETLGIALRILSGILFTTMAALVKAIGDNASLGQIVFFRSAVAMLPLVIFLWLRGCLETQLLGGWPGSDVIPNGYRSQFGEPHVDADHPAAA